MSSLWNSVTQWLSEYRQQVIAATKLQDYVLFDVHFMINDRKLESLGIYVPKDDLNMTVKELAAGALPIVNEKHHPAQFEIVSACKSNEQIIVKVRLIKYEIKPFCVEITCPHMINKNHTTDPFKCPSYYAMKNEYQWIKKNYDHMVEYNHFENESTQKPKCKHNDKCFTYVRLQNEQNEPQLHDLCHLKLYRHPP
eukprot:461590_1